MKLTKQMQPHFKNFQLLVDDVQGQYCLLQLIFFAAMRVKTRLSGRIFQTSEGQRVWKIDLENFLARQKTTQNTTLETEKIVADKLIIIRLSFKMKGARRNRLFSSPLCFRSPQFDSKTIKNCQTEGKRNLNGRALGYLNLTL